jgi:16S rRNA (cytidine1402-2'-O)-methyltransferase
VSGTLYIVATPIGNLEDISLRALRILKEVDRIACEDTRQTGKLLNHYGISKPLISFYEHNERERSEELVGMLEAGQNIALVSDAGTPLIADPGYRLVRLAREKSITVTPIPGASAALAALSASGLATDAFTFRGFLPPKSAQRRRMLETCGLSETTVFYEAPHRILETLEDAQAVFGPRRRPIVVAREITKLHEEFLAGTAEEIRLALASRPAVKGEFVILVGKGEAAPEVLTVPEAVDALLREGVPRMDALKQVARRYGLSKREVYKQVDERE